MMPLSKSKKGFLPVAAIVLIVVTAIVIAAYIATPPDLKILFPVMIVFFILGVLFNKVPLLIGALVGGLYWFILRAAIQLNIMDNPVASFIFGPFVTIAILGFLIGRTLGTFIIN